jgi:hypothetical protein
MVFTKRDFLETSHLFKIGLSVPINNDSNTSNSTFSETVKQIAF